MIPIQLTIEGLYSYQKRQTIDFSNLINAGLFGIFGAVGSGKSSILEAITFALYGETERLNAKDKRAYNMMNLKSNSSYIAFDFLNFEDKTFRITREYKRNSKRFEEIKPSTVVLYEKMNNDWIPLNHTNLREIIGLSYDNFKRTIIIPQGKFKEFIELGAKDRTQMMKEIFNLHKYDLYDKVSVLNSRNLTQLNQLEGKLSGFEEVSEEHIAFLQDQLTSEIEILNIKKTDFETIGKKLQALENIKSDVELLQNKQNAFSELAQQKPEIERKNAELDLYEKVYKIFHQQLVDLEKTEKNIQSISIQAKDQESKLNISETELSKISQKITELQPAFNQLPQKRLEEEDLKRIAENIYFESEIIELKSRSEKGSEKVNEVEENIETIRKIIKSADEEIMQLTKNQIDSAILISAGNWFIQQQNLLKNRKNQQEKIKGIQAEIVQISNELAAANVSVNNFENDVQLKKTTYNSQKNQLEEKRRNLEVQQKLSHFAHNLHNGEACPLCGALEHPAVIVLDDVTTNLEALQVESTHLDNQYNEWVDFTEKIRQKIQKLSLVEEQFLIEKNAIQTIENQLLNHQSQFIWSEFDPADFTDFEHKKNLSLQLNRQVDEKSKLITTQRQLLDTAQEKLEKFKKALAQFKLDEAKKTAQIKQNSANLKVLVSEDFRSFSVEEIQQKLNELQLFNQKTETDFKLLTEQFNYLNNQISGQKASLHSIQKQLNDLNDEYEKLNVLFNQNLSDQNHTKEQVLEVINLKLDVDSTRKQVQDFMIAYKTLHNQIEELQEKLKNQAFSEEELQQQQKQFLTIKNQLEEATENVTKTKTEIQRLTAAFNQKKELLKQQEALRGRAENLKTLSNLFKAAGFVQYVSTIYLKQLCENANIRFRKMTRNQLHLQINETNDFEVVDYLNEGKTRSVKTLSGGQSFQVSLSLALALAESVQVHTKAGKNFFFIDEGFGTQDTESVNIVFETLNNLHKENRIVGIISHVEELKERIPTALQITKSDENGSLIEII